MLCSQAIDFATLCTSQPLLHRCGLLCLGLQERACQLCNVVASATAQLLFRIHTDRMDAVALLHLRSGENMDGRLLARVSQLVLAPILHQKAAH